MGEPIYLKKGDKKMTVYGRHQAAVHVKAGWSYVSDQDASMAPMPLLTATDAARALAGEYDIDLRSVTGTGKDGNITVADVRAAIPEGAE